MTDHQRCEDEIRRLGEAVQSLTRSGCDNALRYAAATHASNAVFAVAHGVRIEQEVAIIAPAYLAQGEALREARAELARLREMARVVGMGPSL